MDEGCRICKISGKGHYCHGETAKGSKSAVMSGYVNCDNDHILPDNMWGEKCPMCHTDEYVFVRRDMLNDLFNCGYNSGHDDTVENSFQRVLPEDYHTANNDVINEWINDLEPNLPLISLNRLSSDYVRLRDKVKSIFKRTKSFMMGIIIGSTLSQPTKHYILRMIEDVEEWEIME